MSTKETQSVCKHCGDLDRQFAHLKSANTGAWQYRNEHGHWVTCETQQRTSKPAVSEPASTGEQPTSLHCGCPDENHLPSCPTIFGAARPSEPSAPAHEVNSLSVQKRKHVMQGGKMSDFKAQPVAPDSHLGAVRD